ncbi:sensor histidine kinase [Anaeromicropila herbilytica]|nr:sensor histidine kinase [Anaeromicropila herbilytica]
MQKQIHTISLELNRILTDETDEKVMLFTSDNKISSLIEQINCALESRQKARTDFRKSELRSKRMLSNVSHDIKTPMTVILGYLEIMRLDNRCQMDMLGKVEKKANEVMNLINEFFTLAKIEAGDIDFTMSRIDINEFCKEIILDFYEILTEKDIQVDIQIPNKKLYVYSNQEALKRILLNLITNALRYGSDGKYLGLYIHDNETKITIDIIDKGKGIRKVQKEHVFERLYTMDDSRNKEVQGNGLGLTIAKELAEKLGVTISLESEPYIRTAFSLELSRIKY